MAGLYAVPRPQTGIRRIAGYVHRLANLFAAAVPDGGTVISKAGSTPCWWPPGPRTDAVLASAEAAGYTLRRVDNGTIGVAVASTKSQPRRRGRAGPCCLPASRPTSTRWTPAWPTPSRPAWRAARAYLTHPVFNTHHSETEMLRYLKRLQNRDLALDHS